MIGLMGGEHFQVEKPTAMSGEVHRRVGLASQKRGELDSAFESFRKCPLDNSIMVLLFYLAQDFENATDSTYYRSSSLLVLTPAGVNKSINKLAMDVDKPKAMGQK